MVASRLSRPATTAHATAQIPAPASQQGIKTLGNLLPVASSAAENTQGILPATGSSSLDSLHDRTPPSFAKVV
jgi:hypothetical protein